MQQRDVVYTQEGSWRRRFNAAVADGVLMFVVYLLIIVIGSVLAPMHGPEVVGIFATLIVATSVWLLISMTEVYQAASRGQSACGLVIAASDGQAASDRALWLRWFVRHIVTIMLLAFLVWSFLAYAAVARSEMSIARSRVRHIQQAGMGTMLVMIAMTAIAWGAGARSGSAFYDHIARTKVFRADHPVRHRGFEPVVPEVEGAEEDQA